MRARALTFPMALTLTSALGACNGGVSDEAAGGSAAASTNTTSSATGNTALTSSATASSSSSTGSASSTSSTGGSCPVGSEGCPCTPGGGCDPSLVCVSEVCSAKSAVCGDGVLDAGEACDLGAALNGDHSICKGDCTAAVCGDGLLGPGEACDDGDADPADGCNDCKLPSCGNGIVEAPEVCDDGNADEDDGCTSLCKAPACGDGFVQSGEGCDAGVLDANWADCTVGCMLATCGDGLVHVGSEQCDDGNSSDTDACTGQCAWAACGDGVVQPSNGESCDDGNQVDADACSSSCQAQSCGDGVVQPALGEQCDDTNPDNTDWCSTTCKLSTCGDGFVHAGYEACDDANTVSGDGCGQCRRIASLASSLGSDRGCVVLSDGAAKCWGSGAAGALGSGATLNLGDGLGEMGDALPAVDLGTSRKAVQISVGPTHTCAVLDDGSAKCWGSNSVGQLGQGDTAAHGDAPGEMGDTLPAIELGAGQAVTEISAGGEHTCAILNGGSVKCWGDNDYGQLGLGDTVKRGMGPNQMGDNLPFVDLGAGRTATHVSAGSNTTCAILDNGYVKCWGSNRFHAAGSPNTVTSIGSGPGQMGDNLSSVQIGSPVSDLSVGLNRACAVRPGAGVYCWGDGSNGDLGNGASGDRPAISPGGQQIPIVPVLLGTGTVPVAVVLSSGTQPGTPQQIPGHACVRLVNGQVKCWGGDGRALGLGSNTSHGDTVQGMGDNLPYVDLGTGAIVTALAAGQRSTCALLSDHTPRCWGRGGAGALGLEDTSDRGDGPNEMGANLPAVLLP